MIAALAISVLASGATAFALVSIIPSRLRSAGLSRPNYRGAEIAVGVGIVAPIGFLVGIATMTVAGEYESLAFYSLVSVLMGFGFLGYLDDRYGDRSVGGFSGHFKALIRGKVTTGAAKALGGGLLAAAYVLAVIGPHFPSRPLYLLILDAMVIALAANLLNLFDLRPGRAIKVYLAMAVLLALVGFGPVALSGSAAPAVTVWLVLLPTSLVLLVGDLRARYMLGDSGSNVLGAAIGLGVAGHLGFGASAAVILGFLWIHWYGERHSITKMIYRNRVLTYLDMLGRTQMENHFVRDPEKP